MTEDVAGTLIHELTSPLFAIPPPRIDNADIIPPDVARRCGGAWHHGAFAARPVTFRLLRDVLVVQEGLVFTRALDLVAASVTGHAPALVAQGRADVAAAIARGDAPVLDGTLILCKKRGVGNYAHWLLEMLPKAALARDHLALPDMRFLVADVVGPLGRAMRDSLGWLGIAEAAIVPTGTAPVLVPRLVLIDGLTEHGGYMSPLAVDAVRRAAAAIAPAAPQPLYVPRLRSGPRMFADESAVIARARAAGFAAFDPGDVPIAAQVAAFGAAPRVAGVMGAGLANIVFAPPGCKVTVFAPAAMPDTFFWFIAGLCGLRYREIRCLAAGPPTGIVPWDAPLQPPPQFGEVFASMPSAPPVPQATLNLPFRDVVADFESLGDNCEFGLVQRAAGLEPLGFFRFNFAHMAPLLRALDSDFADAADPERVEIYAEPPPNHEYMVRIRGYGFQYHTERREGEITPQALHAQQVRAIGLLVRKMLEDLRAAEKIFVRKGEDSTRVEDIRPLLAALRRHGPATLLWVAAADGSALPGTVEVLEPGLLKGHISRFAPYHRAYDIADEWVDICYGAHLLWRERAPAGTVIRGATRSVAPARRPASGLADAARNARMRPDAAPPPRPPVTALAELAPTLDPLPDGRPRIEPHPLLAAETLDLPPFAFGPLEAPAAQAESAAGRIVAPALPAWILRDVEVHGSHGAVTLDATAIAETVRHVDPGHLPRFDRPHAATLPVAYHLLPGDPDSYFLWLTEALFRFGAAQFTALGSVQQAPGGPVLLVPELDRFWKWETLNDFVPGEVPRIALSAAARVVVQRLFYVPGLDAASVPRRVVLAGFDALATRCGHPPAAPPARWRRVYLCQPAGDSPPLLNEAAIIAQLAEAGFVAVTLSDLSIPLQARLFAEASHIIAPHGPGLANIGFCGAGAALCELQSIRRPRWRYRRLAALRGLHYGCLLGAPALQAEAPHAGFCIAPDALAALLRDPRFRPA